jgi:hypothetical protein
MISPQGLTDSLPFADAGLSHEWQMDSKRLHRSRFFHPRDAVRGRGRGWPFSKSRAYEMQFAVAFRQKRCKLGDGNAGSQT